MSPVQVPGSIPRSLEELPGKFEEFQKEMREFQKKSD